MRIVVLQPGYLPWLGFFDQMARCDKFVLYDDVLYDRNGWRNRNRIKTPNGVQWLTVPVLLSEHDGQPRIRDVRIDNRGPWARKHLAAMQQSYGRAPHFTGVFERLHGLLSRPWEWLVELDVAMIEELRDLLGLSTTLALASELGVVGERNDRLLAICARLGASDYLTGDAARSYLDEAAFAQAGVQVEYQEYTHPVYPQLHGPFEPYLSVVDLLVNCGPQSLAILRKTAEDAAPI